MVHPLLLFLVVVLCLLLLPLFLFSSGSLFPFLPRLHLHPTRVKQSMPALPMLEQQEQDLLLYASAITLSTRSVDVFRIICGFKLTVYTSRSVHR